MAEDKFGIDKFAAEINRSGVARPAYFYVMISPPPYLFKGDMAQYFPLRVQSVNMPGRSINTFQRQIIGPPRSMPSGFTTLPVSIEILLSDDMRERQFFMNWQDKMVGWSRGSGGAEAPNMYDIGYYDDAIGTIEIFQFAETPMLQGREQSDTEKVGRQASDLVNALGFDPSVVTNPLGFNLFGLSGKETPKINHATKITLHEVYPFTVNDLAMKWSEPGVAVMTVEFKYVYFSEDHDSLDTGTAQEKSAFRQAMEGFGRFIPVATLLKNTGFKNTAKSVGRQFAGQADALIGTVNAVDPF